MICRCIDCGSSFAPASNDLGRRLCEARRCLSCYAKAGSPQLSPREVRERSRAPVWIPFIHAKQYPTREEFEAAVSRGDVT